MIELVVSALTSAHAPCLLLSSITPMKLLVLCVVTYNHFLIKFRGGHQLVSFYLCFMLCVFVHDGFNINHFVDFCEVL